MSNGAGILIHGVKDVFPDDIYRFLRKRGITIRKSLDCMIASVAIVHDVELLHNDKDFNPIEKYCSLRTVDVLHQN